MARIDARRPVQESRDRGGPSGERGGPGPDRWSVQAARARLSQLIDQAVAGRPQRISRRGRDAVVLIAAADYERLTRPRGSLLAFFRDSPLAEAMAEGEPDLERDPTPIRDVRL